MAQRGLSSLSSLSNPQQTVLEPFLEEITQTAGVVAVVLGGSHARGSARPDSDVDLALYYQPSNPFPIEWLTKVVNAVAVTPPTVTGFYEWGPWVNGGAWIQTAAGKIDLLYRNLDQVTQSIVDAERGVYHHNYLQQPSFGFSSIIYLAETQYCRPLFDPTAKIQKLKRRVLKYPPALRDRVLQDNLWLAEFTLIHAKDFARRGDAFNTIGCLGRAAYFLIHALFALNETYYFGDKGSIEALSPFTSQPADSANRIVTALAVKDNDAVSLAQSVTSLARLFTELVALVGSEYTPKFALGD